jgi:hypothetical protein
VDLFCISCIAYGHVHSGPEAGRAVTVYNGNALCAEHLVARQP